MRNQKRRNGKLREKYSGRRVMLALLSALLLTACGGTQPDSLETAAPSAQEESSQAESYDSVQEVPEYSGEPYVGINDNQPEFEEQELAAFFLSPSHISATALGIFFRCLPVTISVSSINR